MDLFVGELPVWKGVQNKPGFETLPFIFTTELGIIRLKLPEKEVTQISDNYGKATYTFISSPPGTSAWGNRLGAFYFNFLKNWVGDLDQKDVLEIGSGTLYIGNRLINELDARSFYACDPALHTSCKNPKITVCNDYFSYDAISSHKKTFDLIVSINNIEHIPDLSQYLNDVRRFLLPVEGHFFIILPDCYRGFKTGDLGICVHEHMSYFTPESLKFLLCTHGFEIEKIHSCEDTLFVLARPSKSVNRYQEMEYDPLKEPENLLKCFGEHLEDNLVFFSNLLSERRPKGPIAIHGCCVALNNILFLRPLYESNGIFLFDGDTNKTGKFLPVFDKQIISSDDNQYHEMKTVIIAALTFYSEISRDIKALHNIAPENIFPMTPL
ncbi:MAG: methyltransferase domain-containing protein [Methanoregula sp.]